MTVGRGRRGTPMETCSQIQVAFPTGCKLLPIRCAHLDASMGILRGSSCEAGAAISSALHFSQTLIRRLPLADPRAGPGHRALHVDRPDDVQQRQPVRDDPRLLRALRPGRCDVRPVGHRRDDARHVRLALQPHRDRPERGHARDVRRAQRDRPGDLVPLPLRRL